MRSLDRRHNVDELPTLDQHAPANATNAHLARALTRNHGTRLHTTTNITTTTTNTTTTNTTATTNITTTTLARALTRKHGTLLHTHSLPTCPPSLPL